MNLQTQSSFELGEQYWFDGDKYLSSVIRDSIDDFLKEFDLLNEPILSLLPNCRHYARKNYIHKEALNSIVYWCANTDNKVNFDYGCVGLFFYEEVEQVFAKLFMDSFKNYVKDKEPDEIELILTNELMRLNGASFKKLAMKKWGD